jgi:hypothetical protein
MKEESNKKIKNLKKIMQGKEIDLANKIILIKKEPIKAVNLLKIDEFLVYLPLWNEFI